MNTIGENIKKLRHERGWTQDDLSKMTGIGEKYISALESGRRCPGPKIILELCNAFTVSEKELRYGGSVETAPLPTVLQMIVDQVSPLSDAEQHIMLGRVMQLIKEGLR